MVANLKVAEEMHQIRFKFKKNEKAIILNTGFDKK